MGYLYYCKKCNAFEMANTDSDPTVRHWDCAQKCLPLYVTDDAWRRLSSQERGDLIRQAVAMEESGASRKKSKAPVAPVQPVSNSDAAFNQAFAQQPQGGQLQSRGNQLQLQSNQLQPLNNQQMAQGNLQQGNFQQPQGDLQAGPEPSGMQGRVSGMSITAFIMVMTGFLTLIGFILALVDVCKKDGRKKGLSIAALILSSLEVIAVIALIAGVGSILTML